MAAHPLAGVFGVVAHVLPNVESLREGDAAAREHNQEEERLNEVHC